MGFIKVIKDGISKGEIVEASVDFFGDVLDAVSGNPVSVGKIMITLGELPFSIREKLFWDKFSSFLDGVFLSEAIALNCALSLMKMGCGKIIHLGLWTVSIGRRPSKKCSI